MKTNRLKRGAPLFTLLPAALIATGLAVVVASYSPLVFDASSISSDSDTAQAATTIEKKSAKKIEAKSKAKAKKATAEQTGSMEEPAVASSATLADGTWVGYAACGTSNPDGWSPYYVAVSITVKGGKVTAIGSIDGSSTGNSGSSKLSWNASENQVYLTRAIDGRGTSTGVKAQLVAQLPTKGSVSGIDTVSGATYSSISIYNAFVNAIEKSAKAGGVKKTKVAKKTEEPKATEEIDDDNGTDDDSGTTIGDDTEFVRGDFSDVSGTFADGSYVGYALCEDKDDAGSFSPYYVLVTAKAENGRIVSLESEGDADGVVDPAYIYDVNENGTYLNWAIKGKGLRTKGVQKQIQAYLDAGTEIGVVDTVSGATWSSRAIMEAFEAALVKAHETDTPASGDASGSESEATGEQASEQIAEQ